MKRSGKKKRDRRVMIREADIQRLRSRNDSVKSGGDNNNADNKNTKNERDHSRPSNRGVPSLFTGTSDDRTSDSDDDGGGDSPSRTPSRAHLKQRRASAMVQVNDPHLDDYYRKKRTSVVGKIAKNRARHVRTWKRPAVVSAVFRFYCMQGMANMKRGVDATDLQLTTTKFRRFCADSDLISAVGMGGITSNQVDLLFIKLCRKVGLSTLTTRMNEEKFFEAMGYLAIMRYGKTSDARKTGRGKLTADIMNEFFENHLLPRAQELAAESQCIWKVDKMKKKKGKNFKDPLAAAKAREEARRRSTIYSSDLEISPPVAMLIGKYSRQLKLIFVRFAKISLEAKMKFGVRGNSINKAIGGKDSATIDPSLTNRHKKVDWKLIKRQVKGYTLDFAEFREFARHYKFFPDNLSIRDLNRVFQFSSGLSYGFQPPPSKEEEQAPASIDVERLKNITRAGKSPKNKPVGVTVQLGGSDETVADSFVKIEPQPLAGELNFSGFLWAIVKMAENAFLYSATAQTLLQKVQLLLIKIDALNKDIQFQPEDRILDKERYYREASSPRTPASVRSGSPRKTTTPSKRYLDLSSLTIDENKNINISGGMFVQDLDLDDDFGPPKATGPSALFEPKTLELVRDLFSLFCNPPGTLHYTELLSRVAFVRMMRKSTIISRRLPSPVIDIVYNKIMSSTGSSTKSPLTFDHFLLALADLATRLYGNQIQITDALSQMFTTHLEELLLAKLKEKQLRRVKTLNKEKLVHDLFLENHEALRSDDEGDSGDSDGNEGTADGGSSSSPDRKKGGSMRLMRRAQREDQKRQTYVMTALGDKMVRQCVIKYSAALRKVFSTHSQSSPQKIKGQYRHKGGDKYMYRPNLSHSTSLLTPSSKQARTLKAAKNLQPAHSRTFSKQNHSPFSHILTTPARSASSAHSPRRAAARGGGIATPSSPGYTNTINDNRMGESSFRKFCFNYNIVPDYLSQHQLSQIFFEANIGFADSENELDFSFDEFAECLVRIALCAFGGSSYAADYPHPVDKLELLLFIMDDQRDIGFTGFSRQAHSTHPSSHAGSSPSAGASPFNTGHAQVSETWGSGVTPKSRYSDHRQATCSEVKALLG